jgi:hypothetical protein
VAQSKISVDPTVYLVHENALKYITRAGEVRTDVVQAVDQDGNPTTFKRGTLVQFRHFNLS